MQARLGSVLPRLARVRADPGVRRALTHLRYRGHVVGADVERHDVLRLPPVVEERAAAGVGQPPERHQRDVDGAALRQPREVRLGWRRIADVREVSDESVFARVRAPSCGRSTLPSCATLLCLSIAANAYEPAAVTAPAPSERV